MESCAQIWEILERKCCEVKWEELWALEVSFKFQFTLCYLLFHILTNTFLSLFKFRYSMILICVFLLTNVVEYLFIYLLAVLISIFEKCLFKYFIFFNLKEFYMYSEHEFFVCIYLSQLFFPVTLSF